VNRAGGKNDSAAVELPHNPFTSGRRCDVNRKFASSILLAMLLVPVAATRIPADESAAAKGDKRYADDVRKCVDLLIEHGTDRYGKTRAPILVSILDVQTRDCPENPQRLDEAWRVVRRERRNPAGANMLTDQPLLKTMYALSAATGDEKYATFARAYADYYMKNLGDEKGLFWWGWHRHYDVFKDVKTGHAGNHHEIHAIHSIDWESLWNANPQAVRKAIEAIWQWHVIDKKTGEINRHGDGRRGCDFSMSSGAFIEAFAFLYAKTKEDVWLDRAKLLADYYWTRRNRQTDLFPERPNAGQGRFDGSSFVTAITGPYCHSLLKAHELTGEKVFKTQAVALLKAYAKFGFDQETGKFWGALKMDGTPFPGPRVIGGYAQYEPRGHLDLWEPYVAGYQFPIYTAQAYAYAHQLTEDEELLTAAKRFADWIAKNPPSQGCMRESWYQGYATAYAPQGTCAGKYGRTISFYIHLYVVTKNDQYLDQARKMADIAVKKLHHKGLFRGHPAKPYYEAMDGVGYLLYGLLELDLVLKNPKEVLSKQAIIVGKENKRMDLDNW